MSFDFSDRNAVKELGADVAEAVMAVAARHGLKCQVKGGRYDPHAGTYTPRLELQANDKDEREFREYADAFGLSPDDFGRSFVVHGTTYKITGLRTRARTRPIVASAGGKNYTWKALDVARLLARAS
jgi:hypothetical protein